jgi:hypothetical protein
MAEKNPLRQFRKGRKGRPIAQVKREELDAAMKKYFKSGGKITRYERVDGEDVIVS